MTTSFLLWLGKVLLIALGVVVSLFAIGLLLGIALLRWLDGAFPDEEPRRPADGSEGL